MREKYFRTYPDEAISHPYLELKEKEEKFEWYDHPVEQFLQRHIELSKTLSSKEAWNQCVLEKEAEKQALDIERLVCKQQAEELFNIKPTDPFQLLENRFYSSPTDVYEDRDPRVYEWEHKFWRNFIDDAISKRIENPNLPKLNRTTVLVGDDLLTDYLLKNPHLVEHFDESVYTGELKFDKLGGEIETRDWGNFINQFEEDPDLLDQNPETFADPKSYPMMQLFDTKYKQWIDDFIDYHTDKIDLNLVTDPDEQQTLFKKAIKARIQKEERKILAKEAVEKAHEQLADINPTEYDMYSQSFPSFSEEAVFTSQSKIPLQNNLNDELRSLFGKASKPNK